MTRSLSYWETALGVEPQGDVEPIPRRSDVLIVGAGFAGSWLAYFLKKRHPKLAVTVVERDFFTLGASARNAGFLSCGNMSEWLEDSRELGPAETLATFGARVDGIQLIRTELRGAYAEDPCGSVDFDPPTAEAASLAEMFNAYLRSRDLGSIFALKKVRYGGRDQEAFVNSFDGSVNPAEILRALHGRLLDLGVTLRMGHEVTDVGGGLAVSTSKEGDQQLSYGHAFVCTNAFTRQLSPRTEVRPARGQIIVTSPVRTDTTRCLGFLKAGYDYFRFTGDRLLVGGGRKNFKREEDTDRIETTAAVRDYLTRFAGEILGHHDFTVDHHWAGIMGLRSGRHACISEFKQPVRIDAVTEELSSCGGWGVTLSPIVTKMRAEAWG